MGTLEGFVVFMYSNHDTKSVCTYVVFSWRSLDAGDLFEQQGWARGL
jgi:hypothetical protein